jgi:hypothetical protein
MVKGDFVDDQSFVEQHDTAHHLFHGHDSPENPSVAVVQKKKEASGCEEIF